MAFDGADIQIDQVQQTTNLIGNAHQTRNDQTHTHYARSTSMGETTFAGAVGQAARGSTETINSRHRAEIMPRGEQFEENLRLTTNTYTTAEGDAAGTLSRPGSGIGALINPGS